MKKLFSHSLLYAVAPRVASFANIFVLPFTTEKLTELDYGIYATIGIYVALLSVWRDLGLGTISGNAFFKHPKYYKLIWGNILAFNLIWGIFYAGILVLLLTWLIPVEASDNFNMIMILMIIPIILFQPFNSMAQMFFQYQKNPKMIAIPSVISGLTSVLITFYTIYHLEMGYLGWFISAFSAQFLGVLFNLFFFFFKEKIIPIFRFSIRTFKYYLAVSLPVIPHMYAGFMLNSSDRLVMDVLGVSTQSIGQYSFAYTFGNYAQQITQGVNKASVPFYMELLGKRTNEGLLKYRAMTFRLLSISISMSFLACLWLKEIFPYLISNPDLAILYPLAILIVMSYNFNPMYQSVMMVFTFNERTSQLWKFSFVAGAMNIVLNFIFIPIYGIYAAAFTTLISLLFLGFAGIFFKSFKDHQPHDYYPFYWIVSILVFLAAAYTFKDTSILNKSLLTVGALSILAFLEFTKRFSKPIKDDKDVN